MIQTLKQRKYPHSHRLTGVKHINELADSLKTHEKAILLNTFQYDNPGYEILNPSTNYIEVSENVDRCIKKGLKIWQINMKIDHDSVELLRYWNTTSKFRKIK